MRHLCFILFCSVFFGLYAHNEHIADSLSQQLDEIVVESPVVIRKADKWIYAVNESLKEHSATAMDLLKKMQIPTLTVNEVMEKVASSLGSVQIRINGREADIQQLKSINPAFVARVEWIDNPGLKYGANVGAVLNVVVTNPGVGGSFNMSVMEGATVFFNNSSANLTLNNGRSQWKAGAWANFRGKLDLYREYNDSYRLPDGSILQRTQTPVGGYFDQAVATPYISYNYMRPDTTNFYVGFNMYDSWKQELVYEGVLESAQSRNSEIVRLIEKDKNPENINPSLNVYLEQKIGQNNTLMFSAATSYVSDVSGHNYVEIDEHTGAELVNVDNDIKSKTYGIYVEGNYVRNLAKAGRLTVGLRYNGSSVKSTYLDYEHQSIRQHLDKLYFFGEYMIPYRKFTFTLGLGGTWNRSSMKNVATESSLDFTPRVSLNWRYNDMSRWYITYNNYVQSPSASELSPVTQAIDGIQIEKGNPELHSYLTHRLRVGYSFANNKNLGISVYGFYSHISHPIFKYYSWEGDNILRSYSNSGNYNTAGASLSVSYSPLPDWMSLSADVSFSRFHNTGKGFTHSLNSCAQNVSVEIYHWNWNLGFDFYNPQSQLWGETVTRGERFNTLSLSYSWKSWNFSAILFMAFGQYSQSVKVVSNLVSQNTVTRTSKIQRMPMVRISYNINWGYQKQARRHQLEGTIDNAGGAKAAGR